MLIKKNNVPSFTETAPMGGEGNLFLEKMSKVGCLPGAVATFAKATLAPGASVGYHVHTGDSEAYYFLAGSGEYEEGGAVFAVSAGDFTYTPDGDGHGVRNVGDTPLEFIALIIKS